MCTGGGRNRSLRRLQATPEGETLPNKLIAAISDNLQDFLDFLNYFIQTRPTEMNAVPKAVSIKSRQVNKTNRVHLTQSRVAFSMESKRHIQTGKKGDKP
jgi:hypothetical protein